MSYKQRTRNTQRSSHADSKVDDKAKPANTSSGAPRIRKRKVDEIQEKDDDASEEYDVSAIVGHRGFGSEQELRVRWKGYKADEDTWELRTSVELHAKTMVEKYYTNAKEMILLKIVDHREDTGRLQYHCVWSDGAVKNQVCKRWEPEEIVPTHLITEYFRSPKSV